MNGIGKTLKLLCLADLIFGLAACACSIALAASSPQTPHPYVALCSALVSLYLGVRGAILANVPSNAGKIMRIASVASLLDLAAVAFLFVVSGGTVLALVVAMASFAFAMGIFLAARKLVDIQSKA